MEKVFLTKFYILPLEILWDPCTVAISIFSPLVLQYPYVCVGTHQLGCVWQARGRQMASKL